MRRIAGVALFVGGLALAQGAFAHTPYLKPTTFAPKHPFVSVEAALTEGAFFVPDMPIRGEAPFWVTGNDGQPVKAANVVMLKEFAVVEVDLPADGTYRISTGERAGRSAKWVKIDGAWKMVRPAGGPGRGGGAPPAGAPPAGGPPAGAAGGGPPPGAGGGQSRFVEESAIPAGAETMTAVGYNRSETYVTKGAPTNGALKPTGQGLEVEAISHPNEAFAGEAFKIRVLNDGKPLPTFAFTLSRAGDVYVDQRFAQTVRTDAAGAASLKLPTPGVYVLQASYPVREEGAAPAPVAKSSSYTLTFEVTR
ncbi:DUF4198 domain-containing protein [Phenylobacterium sp.]|uniref:DUF4198 domain-containing protein n=1 Tax=Phenylobacterium sp. TaxID=1871053 RepID=UPI0025ECAA47|nr:DUF4198 domain-containing protein [Phenylobacterium sp.]MBX3483654.1 DUF4198 domain-containing protein [Phenylobacterium sp.]